MAWKLLKADVLVMLGSKAAAKECARDVVQLEGTATALAHFEGKIAAWTAALAETDAELAEASDRLSTLVKGLEQLDLIDQAEVLAGAMLVRWKVSRDLETLPARLDSTLRRLPRPTARLLLELRLTPELRTLFPGCF